MEVTHSPTSSLYANRNANNELHYSIWFVFFWNLLYALVLIIVIVGVTDHRQMNVDVPKTILVGASVTNVVSDLMILVIPIAVVWGLHMAKEKKIKLAAIFGVGSLWVCSFAVCQGNCFTKLVDHDMEGMDQKSPEGF